VIERVGEDQAVRHQARQRRYAGFICNIARGEDQRGVLAVQVGELALELHQRMVVAGDIARAAGAGAHSGRGLDHGADDFRMLAHAEIVVGAPDDDGFRSLRRMPHCMRKAPGDALQISEYPVAPFGMEPRQRSGEIAVVINVRAIIGVGHWQSCPAVGRPEYWSYLGRVLEAFQGVCRGQYRRTWRLALHKNPQFDRGGTCSRNAEVEAAALRREHPCDTVQTRGC
jgi:hypothetical protein